MLYFSTDKKRKVTQCNFNYSSEGILHPDRIMSEYDFLYMIKGSWEIKEENDVYLLKEGQLLILEPGKHHFSTEKCSPHMRNMFLHCEFLNEDTANIPGLVPVGKLTDCTGNLQITMLFQQIIEEYWTGGDSFHEQRLSALFELLLYELSAQSSKSSTLDDPVVNEIKQLFLTNSDRFFHTEELSARFGLSARTLGQRFKSVTGNTLYQYQLSQKLSMIHELLPQNPNRGLRDIALSFGFYDEFQLSKLYKRQFGYAPSRRRISSI